MAFTVRGEYERLTKIKENNKDNEIPFACGCACGVVTNIMYYPHRYNEEIHDFQDEEIHIYGIAGWDKYEKLLFTITENDVYRRYQDRKYRYWKEYGILELFEGR